MVAVVNWERFFHWSYSSFGTLSSPHLPQNCSVDSPTLFRCYTRPGIGVLLPLTLYVGPNILQQTVATQFVSYAAPSITRASATSASRLATIGGDVVVVNGARHVRLRSAEYDALGTESMPVL